MANVRKRILELTPLPSASLDTTIVGVDGGTTYRIELDVLADAVTSRVNILDRDRLASLESVTSSFESKGRSVISSSAQITAFGFISSSVTIPTGTISSSAQITSFGFISQSVDITSLNSFTSSQQTLNTAFTNGISARLQTSSFNDFSTSVDSRIIAATNEQSLTHLVTTSSFNEYTASISTGSLVNRLNAIESVSGSWITESETGSFLTSLNGAISSSSQLTSSYDTRYTLSGSVQPLPSNLLSSSAQITAFGFVSGSYETTGRGIISSSANLVTTSSYNADSASFDSRINSIVTESGSNLTYFIEAYANVTYTLPGGFTEDICRYSVVSDTENVPSNWFNTSTYRFTPQKAGYWEINAAYDVYRNTEASMAIRKNGSIVTSAGSFNAVAQDISKIIYLNGSTDYIDIVNTGGAALQRNQYQQRSWFQAKFVGNISGSTDLPAGVISGSSQLTSSFDTRYALSASFVSSSNVSSIQTITSASYAALTPVSGTLYIIIG